MGSIRILGISGSLRRGSHNTSLLRAAARSLPPGIELELYDGLADLPHYNEDLDHEPVPAAVARLRGAIAAADGLLIATPEYNGSIPGVLKNAVDWASRPFPDSAVKGKPVAVVGASTSLFGAVWAQAATRKALHIAGADVLDGELPVGQAHVAFTSDSHLTDPEIQSRSTSSSACSRRARVRRASRPHRPKRQPSQLREPHRLTHVANVPIDLPMARPAAADGERADARRNRERILCAAAGLIDERGVDGVSMDDVAAKAGVGKGTLYRRFGDTATLLRALIEEPERAFQEALIRGEPPLGPGIPPRQRLHAFGAGMLRLLEQNARFLRATEVEKAGRYNHPIYAFYQTHVGLLLREILGESATTEYLVDSLLAPLSADAFIYQREIRGMSVEQMTDGWCTLATAIAGPIPPDSETAAREELAHLRRALARVAASDLELPGTFL